MMYSVLVKTPRKTCASIAYAHYGSIKGSILGSPIFGNSHVGFEGWRLEQSLQCKLCRRYTWFQHVPRFVNGVNTQLFLTGPTVTTGVDAKLG